MFSKTMSDWIDGFDSDQPTSDGAWANAWSPVWDDAPAAKSVAARLGNAPAHAHPRQSRAGRDANFMGSTLNNG